MTYDRPASAEFKGDFPARACCRSLRKTVQLREIIVGEGAFEERREEFLTCSRVRCDGPLREQRRKVKKGRQRGESVRRPSPEIRKVNGGESGIYEVIPAQQNGNTKALSCLFVSHAVFHCRVFRVLL